MIPDGNLELQEKIMITGNCRYMGKYQNIFPYFSSILYKIVDCLEKKKNPTR